LFGFGCPACVASPFAFGGWDGLAERLKLWWYRQFSWLRLFLLFLFSLIVGRRFFYLSVFIVFLYSLYASFFLKFLSHILD
jgi:hypothetical protein